MSGSSDTSTDNDLLLQVAYSNVFDNFNLFIQLKFPLDKCMGDICNEDIIDTDCKERIAAADSIDRERKILVEFLRNKNEVATYDKFIAVCDKYKPEFANDIKDRIDKEKKRCGLPVSYHPLKKSETSSQNEKNEDEGDLILVAYTKTFLDNGVFIENSLRHNTYPEELLSKNIIDAECNTRLLSLDIMERSQAIMEYLKSKSAVSLYAKLILFLEEKNRSVGLHLIKRLDYHKERLGVRSGKQTGKAEVMKEATVRVGPEGDNAVKPSSSSCIPIRQPTDELDSTSRKRKITVLCIDGGGVRGLTAIKILQYITRKAGKQPYEMFDMICGTSTGGIIAVLLGLLKISLSSIDSSAQIKESSNLSTQNNGNEETHLDCESLYRQLSKDIFYKYWYYPTYWLRMALGWGVYDTKALEDKICEVVKKITKNSNTKMSERAQSLAHINRVPYVFVTSLRTGGNNRLVLFNNYANNDDNNSNYRRISDVEIWKAVRATSAAPTYFDEMKIGDFNYVDGGFGTNNPSEKALEECDKLFPNDDILLISIGLGLKPSNPQSRVPFLKLKDMGLEIITDCEKTHENMLNKKASPQYSSKLTYYRLNPPSDLARIGLDDYNKIDRIIQITNEYLDKVGSDNTVNEVIAELKKNSG